MWNGGRFDGGGTVSYLRESLKLVRAVHAMRCSGTGVAILERLVSSLIGSCGASHIYFLFHFFEVLLPYSTFLVNFARMGGGGASKEEMGEGGDDGGG